jgi:hypothetical protein
MYLEAPDRNFKSTSDKWKEKIYFNQGFWAERFLQAGTGETASKNQSWKKA